MKAWVVLLVAGLTAGCGSAAAAARAKDPMQCERDATCSRARGAYPDCTKQCVDDQECERRCEEVQHGVDGVGHP
jgi:hypothetical protein